MILFGIGVDRGNGYTKVASSQIEAVFPSLVARPIGHGLNGLLADSSARPEDYLHVAIRVGGHEGEYVVGDMARRCGIEAAISVSDDKARDQNTPVLLSVALALAAPEPSDGLAVVAGLPLSVFLDRKDELRDTLMQLNGDVRFLAGPWKGEGRRFEVRAAKVLPEAIGLMLKIGKEGGAVDGRTAAINVGFKTTEILTTEGMRPVEALSGSEEIGTYHVAMTMSELFRQKYKKGLPLELAEKAVYDGYLDFGSERLDLGGLILEAKDYVGQKIQARLRTLWGNDLNFFRRIYLAGGGARLLADKLGLSGAVVVSGPQMTNAQGFLVAAQGIG